MYASYIDRGKSELQKLEALPLIPNLGGGEWVEVIFGILSVSWCKNFQKIPILILTMLNIH